MFKKNDIDGMMLQVSQQMLHGGPSATPVSTTQTANSGVIGYQNLHNGTLLRQNHQIPNSNQIPFVNENQSLFTPYSYNHYQRMLGNNYIAHPNELPATMGINSEQDVVKNYRSLHHTNSFSGSPTSRPGFSYYWTGYPQ